jgi:hypothetical protein
MNHIGRPPNIDRSLPLNWSAEKYVTEATFFVDMVASMSYHSLMPMYADVYNTLQQRLVYVCGRVNKIRERMKELASAYNEFVELRDELQRHTEQINNLKGVFGPAFTEVETSDESAVIGGTSEITPSWREVRDTLPLWIALREYLSAAGEARVGEAEEFLNFLQFPNVRRQSIESALRRHPDVFRVRKTGKEKFISLKKGAEYASSTNDKRK